MCTLECLLFWFLFGKNGFQKSDSLGRHRFSTLLTETAVAGFSMVASLPSLSPGRKPYLGPSRGSWVLRAGAYVHGAGLLGSHGTLEGPELTLGSPCEGPPACTGSPPLALCIQDAIPNVTSRSFLLHWCTDPKHLLLPSPKRKPCIRLTAAHSLGSRISNLTAGGVHLYSVGGSPTQLNLRSPGQGSRWERASAERRDQGHSHRCPCLHG